MSAHMPKRDPQEWEPETPSRRMRVVRRRANPVLKAMMVLLALLVVAVLVLGIIGLSDLTGLNHGVQSISSQISHQSNVMRGIQRELARIAAIIQTGLQQISIQLAHLTRAVGH